ncbi:dihydroxyacetone kinase subunit DhaK [Streptococcus cuniculi]|nr:dihydroxyacetone kinase subunit DhaK [Streptococcus cuniculi]
MDQYICYRKLNELLTTDQIAIHKSLVGNFATSMDMVGMSITLLRVDAELKELLDLPCDTPYYKA